MLDYARSNLLNLRKPTEKFIAEVNSTVPPGYAGKRKPFI
jgi:hypothetical protein